MNIVLSTPELLAAIDGAIRERRPDADRVMRYARMLTSQTRWKLDWFVTAPNPRVAMVAQNADAGQRGWRLHALMVNGGNADTLTSIKHYRSACGISPPHGWTIDMLIEQKCERCERALLKFGLQPPEATR